MATMDVCSDVCSSELLFQPIVRVGPPRANNSWIAKSICPGGYMSALSEMAAAGEKTGLLMTELDVLRLHYAETLREWRKRFMARRDEALKIYDERFCRMWEFYLAGSETSFRHEGMVNFQMQITRKIDTLPITRDYMAESDTGLGALQHRRMMAGAGCHKSRKN